MHTPERPHMCEYQITDDDQELRNVTFSNGTKPTTLTFGCTSSESCCGMECCSNTSWVTIILIIVGIVLIIILCVWCNSKGYCRDETVIVTEVPVFATTTTTHTFTTNNGPPPPPGFQGFQQGPPPSAPVYSAPPPYNNFQQNSPYGGRPISSGQVHTSYKQ